MKCGICGRLLDQPGNPLSVDCGGDCWGCIGEIEADMGDPVSLAKVREAITYGTAGASLKPAAVDSKSAMIFAGRPAAIFPPDRSHD